METITIPESTIAFVKHGSPAHARDSLARSASSARSVLSAVRSIPLSTVREVALSAVAAMLIVGSMIFVTAFFTI